MRNSPLFLPKVDISLASDDMRIKVLLIFWNSSELHPPPPQKKKKRKKEKKKQNKTKQSNKEATLKNSLHVFV